MISIRRTVVFAFACSVVCACGSSDDSPVDLSSGRPTGAGGTSSEGTGGGSAGSAVSPTGTGGDQAGGSAGSGSAVGGSGGGSVADSGPAAEGGNTADAGPMNCPAGALLCDDFEGDGLGAGSSPWKIETMNTSNDVAKTGKVELTTTKPAHGAHSVHIVVPDTAAGDPAGGSPAFISETKTFPTLANDLWGRMLVFYTPKAALPNSHWVNIATVGSAPSPDQQLRIGGSGAAKLNSNELPSDTFANSATVMPVNKWVCFEWHLQAGTAANIHFYLNGTELTDVAVVDGNSPNTTDKKWHSVPFAKLQLGWQYWNGSFGGEMWLDDVAIGSARLTCPPLP